MGTFTFYSPGLSNRLKTCLVSSRKGDEDLDVNSGVFKVKAWSSQLGCTTDFTLKGHMGWGLTGGTRGADESFVPAAPIPHPSSFNPSIHHLIQGVPSFSLIFL